LTGRATFFDFGGTLASLDPSINEPWRVWSRVVRELNLRVSDSAIVNANQAADRRFKGDIFAYHGMTHEFWRIRDGWVIDQLGISTQKEEYFHALQAVFSDPAMVRPNPETAEVLRGLRRAGFKLWVISNFTDGLIRLLTHHGVLELLESVTYSQEVGAEKPDSRVLSLALERAGCRPPKAVHVRDSWQSGYLGAKRAGLRAIWLNREGEVPPGPCEMVRDLREVSHHKWIESSARVA
jgi:putative hydrolase of the HAD superfamily